MILVILIGYIAYAMGAYNYFAAMDYAPASKCVDGADLGDYTGVTFGSVDSCYEFGGAGFKIACAADGSTYTMSVYSTADCSDTPIVGQLQLPILVMWIPQMMKLANGYVPKQI